MLEEDLAIEAAALGVLAPRLDLDVFPRPIVSLG
jgi:hypothetical protein